MFFFGPVLINLVNIEPSIINENWPSLKIIFHVIVTLNSALVPCISSSVNVKSTSVIKLLCYHPNLTWEHVLDNPSRPRTSLTKGPEHAVKRNFQNSPQADMNFRPCLSAFCFND